MQYALVYPMFAMVILTFAVVVGLFRSRTKSVVSGSVSAAYFRTYSTGDSEPDSSLKYSRHFTNLFEVPTLFYAGCLAITATGQADIALVVLAWSYVLCRVLHAVIHTGGNRLKSRIRIYFLGWLVLLALWIYFVVRLGIST